MVSGKVDILQQLACFLHAGVQLIILIVLVELIKSFGKGTVGDTVIRHFNGTCGVGVGVKLGDLCKVDCSCKLNGAWAGLLVGVCEHHGTSQLKHET
jgi:hypothetical protein